MEQNTAPSSYDASTSSNLASYVQGILTEAKTNRVKVQKKWLRNYAAANVDENFDPDTWKEKESKKKKSWKSEAYLDVTRQKITAFMNLITDVMFKGGKVPFMLDPEPDYLASGVNPFMVEQAIEMNQALIHQQMKATGSIHELTRILLSGAVYGEYYAKKYVTEMVTDKSIEAAPGVVVKDVQRSQTTAIEYCSIWHLWWEREAGDIKKAEYVFHRKMAGNRDIRRFGTENPFVIKKNVTAVLDKSGNRSRQTQSPADTATLPPGHRTVPRRTRPTEIYESWLWVPRESADQFERDNGIEPTEQPEAMEREGQDTPGTNLDGLGRDGDKDGSDRVYIVCWLCEGEIIGYCREPGDHVFEGEQFEDCIDSLYGRGIADNVEPWQKGLNGAVRSFENNTKLIANLILAIKREHMKNRPEDQIDEGGIIELDPECPDVRQAVQQLAFQDITGPLIKAIEMFSSFSDLASNMPRIAQGQQSDNAQTAFELNQRLQQSGKYVGGIASKLDRMLAWHAQSLYDRNMMDQENGVPKIPCAVKALGFTSFENRFLRLQKLMQMIQMVLSDASGELKSITKLRWLWEEVGKANDLETAQYIKSPEEIMQDQQAAQEAQAAAAQPPAPPAEDPLTQVNAEEKLAKADKYKADAEAKRTDTALKAHQIQPGTHPGLRGIVVQPRK